LSRGRITYVSGLPLPPPPAAVKIVEHDLVAAAGGDDLPVAAAQRAVSPPPVLDQPRLAHAVDLPAVDEQRATTVVGGNGDPARNGEATRSAHDAGFLFATDLV
jgi:hypothetical protein